MSSKTRKRLDTVANALERSVIKTLEVVAYTLQLIVIDLTYGKSTYRKREPKPRPVILRTTVIYHELVPSERVIPRKRRIER